MGVVLPTLQDAYSKVALPTPIPDNPSVEPVPRKKISKRPQLQTGNWRANLQ